MRLGNEMIKAAVVLGMLAIVAALLAGGRYTVTQQGSMAYVVDRFTGAVRFCTREECLDVPSNAVVKQDNGGFTRLPQNQSWPGVQEGAAATPEKKGPWTQYEKK